MIEYVKLTAVRQCAPYRLALTFSNGAQGDYDLSGMVEQGGPMVDPLRDARFFARAYVDCGALAWPNGFDLDPTQLYSDMKEAGAFDPVSVA